MRLDTKIQKGIQYWKRNGTKAFLHRLTHPYGIKPIPYHKWLEAQRLAGAKEGGEGHLDGAPGIQGKTLSDMPRGEWLAFAGAGGVWERDAWETIVAYLQTHPECDCLYADEGFLRENGRAFAPCFKPDYSPDYLSCVNYIGHPFLVKRALFEEIYDCAGEGKRLTERLHDLQDAIAYWEMVLLCCAKAKKVGHIAKPLLHTSARGKEQIREYKSARGTKLVSYGPLPDGAEEMLKKQLEGKEGEVVLQEIERAASGDCLRPIYYPRRHPRVSILIPNKDEAETLRTCVSSILEKTTYDNYEIVILENNSEKEETAACYAQLEETSERIRVRCFDGAFNYARINNFGAAQAEGEYLLFLNNDTEVITPDWIERMLGYCMQEEIGIVGAKLLYPDGSVQHGGVVMGIGGGASHVLNKEAREEDGYLCRLQAVTDVSAVTAACLMISRELYDRVGGMDESFVVNFNDVLLCLAARDAGHRVVMHAGVELFHYESKSRGLDTTGEKYERFMDEVYRLRKRAEALLEEGDPYYNPNLSLMFVDCRPCYEKEHFAFIEQVEKEKAHG